MKKYLSLILALGICMSMCVFPAAAISANEAENEVLTEDEFTELLTAEMSSNEFGGLYYEGDTLVVNVIASQKATSLRPQLAQKAPEDIDVEYRTVTYSLSELERIKNFLTGYMSDYSIMMLDANEITNQVDISLKDYSDDNIESIKAAVLSHGGKTDYLNFIDDSNNVIRSTVGYETDNNASPFSLYGKVPVSFTAKASTTQYLTGGKILIGNYAYTLGPALSASKAYSAGHGYSAAPGGWQR